MGEKLAHMQGVARLRRDGTSRLFNTLFSSDSSPAHFLSRLLLSLTAMSEPPTSECSYTFPDDRWERCVNSAAFDDACAECAREVHLGSLSDDSDSDYRYHGNLLETDSSSLSPYDVSKVEATFTITVSGAPYAGVPSWSSGRPRMSSCRGQKNMLVPCGFCRSMSTKNSARTIYGLLFVLRFVTFSKWNNLWTDSSQGC